MLGPVPVPVPVPGPVPVPAPVPAPAPGAGRAGLHDGGTAGGGPAATRPGIVADA